MAFGDYKGGDKTSLTSVTNPTAVPTGFYCAGGWLAIVSTVTTTGLTAGTCTDIGSGANTFTPFNNGLDVGPAWRGYFSIITNPGIVRPSVAFTGSAQDVCVIMGVWEGPFSPTAQLDGNPAILADAASPYTSNLTGVLAQADELVYSTLIGTVARAATATSPNVFRDEQLSAAAGTTGSVSAALGSWVVSINTSISATWTTGTNFTGGVHIATFKKDPATNTLLAQAAM